MTPFEAQEGEEGLAAHPNRARLAGDLPGLTFPPLCPNCGSAAAGDLEIAKVFMRTHSDDRLRQFEVVRIDAPFCQPCIDQHRAAQTPITPVQTVGSLLGAELIFPGIGLGLLALFFTKAMIGGIVRDPIGSWPLALLLAVLFALSWFCLRAAWDKGERFRVPAQSVVTESFDYGDDQSTAFGTQGRLYAIRDARFAEAFTALNQGRSTELLGPKGKARTNRNLIIGVVIVAVVIVSGLLMSC